MLLPVIAGLIIFKALEKSGKKTRGRGGFNPLQGDKVFGRGVRICNKQEPDIRMSLKRLS